MEALVLIQLELIKNLFRLKTELTVLHDKKLNWDLLAPQVLFIADGWKLRYAFWPTVVTVL